VQQYKANLSGTDTDQYKMSTQKRGSESNSTVEASAEQGGRHHSSPPHHLPHQSSPPTSSGGGAPMMHLQPYPPSSSSSHGGYHHNAYSYPHPHSQHPGSYMGGYPAMMQQQPDGVPSPYNGVHGYVRSSSFPEGFRQANQQLQQHGGGRGMPPPGPYSQQQLQEQHGTPPGFATKKVTPDARQQPQLQPTPPQQQQEYVSPPQSKRQKRSPATTASGSGRKKGDSTGKKTPSSKRSRKTPATAPSTKSGRGTFRFVLDYRKMCTLDFGRATPIFSVASPLPFLDHWHCFCLRRFR